MSLIPKFYNNCLTYILLSTVLVPIGSYAKFPVGQSQTADFQLQKNQLMNLVGCSTSNDTQCLKMRDAPDMCDFLPAYAMKKSSDEKKIKDRVNVLECCLGVDEKDTCVGLSVDSAKDLKACKQRLEKK
jgi:hypothetical protein